MHTALRQVHVRVPATTANLGSGFDILGLALQLYNVFTLTSTSDPGWRVRLPPWARLPSDDRNLVFRAARALLGWSQQDLADKAIVSLNALTRLERGEVDPRWSTLQAVHKALTEAGVEFLSGGGKGEGVRLVDPNP